MKKFLSLLLALTMMLSLSITAFAADTSPKTITSVEANSNTASFDVTGTVTVNEDAYADIVYSVLVEWTVAPLALEVNKTQPYTWDPATLKYVPGDATAAPASIEAKDVAVTIKLTNSSNAAVNYTVAYADNGDDAWTTAVKSGSESNATGKLDNADAIDGLATVYATDAHAYTIDIAKQGDEGKGTAKEQTYTGTVTLPAITDTKAMTSGTLTLGTYTVTLSAAAAEEEVTFRTVQEILDTVSNFPRSSTDSWKADGDPNQLVYVNGSSLYIAGCQFGLSATVTPDGSKYKVVKADEFSSKTVTFSMTDNKLASIEATITMGDTKTYTFTVPTT